MCAYHNRRGFSSDKVSLPYLASFRASSASLLLLWEEDGFPPFPDQERERERERANTPTSLSLSSSFNTPAGYYEEERKPWHFAGASGNHEGRQQHFPIVCARGSRKKPGLNGIRSIKARARRIMVFKSVKRRTNRDSKL